MSDRYANIIYQQPGADLAEYRLIMFGTLEVDFPQLKSEPDNSDIQRLRKEFRDAFLRELQRSKAGLQTRYVDQNGRDVLLVKAYLRGARSVSENSPAMKSGQASDSLLIDSSLTLDISLLDSLSGEVLIRAAETRSQSRHADSANVRWIEVSAMANEWAERVVAFLDEHLSE